MQVLVLAALLRTKVLYLSQQLSKQTQNPRELRRKTMADEAPVLYDGTMTQPYGTGSRNQGTIHDDAFFLGTAGTWTRKTPDWRVCVAVTRTWQAAAHQGLDDTNSVSPFLTARLEKSMRCLSRRIDFRLHSHLPSPDVDKVT
ncbi:hypothetical protein C8035_v001438 [Colletotrichum spinosum]|uniref:Uncharacterized protein n=1 Tax=Colletotrichum spinosum TaxID=1347390 RepID=A0A4R8Q4U1_9PEZI|nr:hypothetical protein C8035_v001438 [Colletotrichum spinosum]